MRKTVGVSSARPPFRAASVSDGEYVELPGDAPHWLPLRRQLGVTAFGVNAYRAERAGDAVIEEHVESPGQEEIYFVVAGRARFVVGGEELEAAAGTVLFVPDPDLRRGGEALEDGTVVLAIGGWPGEAYRTLPWEPIYLARPAMGRGDWAEAAEILESEAGEHLDTGIVRYRIACCRAQLGERQAALKELRRAIEINPHLRERAENEDALAELRASEGWESAVS